MIRRLLRRLRRLLIVLLLAAILVPPAMIVLYRAVPPPLSTLMIWRLFEGQGLDKQWRPLEEISPQLPRAVVAAEDNFFCRHNGIDWQSMGEVIDDKLAGERTRGASTLTMQLAKNLFLWPSRSYTRKLLELYLTPQLEFILGKERLIEIYLNVVEWGPGLYGAEVAAQRYFGKPAARLSLTEASLLATALPNPLQRNPARPSKAMTRRAAVYRTRIEQLGPLLDCLPK